LAYRDTCIITKLDTPNKINDHTNCGGMVIYLQTLGLKVHRNWIAALSVDSVPYICYNLSLYAGIAQLLERILAKEEN